MYKHERRASLPKKPQVANRAPFPAPARQLTGLLDTYLKERRLSPKVADCNAWYVSQAAGDYLPRIVIPASSLVEGHNYWQARAMHPDATIRYQSPLVARLDAIIAVYPVFTAQRRAATVLCEGPMDALAAAELGYMSIALMGNNPASCVFDHIHTIIRENPIIVVGDKDAASAWTQVAKALWLRGMLVLRRVVCVMEKDLAAMTIEQRTQTIQGG